MTVYIDYYNKLKYKNLDKEIFDYLDKYNDLLIKYEIGKQLNNKQSIEDYSNKLKKDSIKILPTMLRKYRLFYELIEKGMLFYQDLSWNHYLLLMRIKDLNKINYYLYISKMNNLTIRELQRKIDFLEYDNLQIDLRNKYKLIINKENRINIYNFIISDNLETIEYIKKIIFQRIEIINKVFNISYIEKDKTLPSSSNVYKADFIFLDYKNKAHLIVNFVIGKLTNEHINYINNFVSIYDEIYRNKILNNTEALIFVYRNKEFYLEYSKYNTYELKKYYII